MPMLQIDGVDIAEIDPIIAAQVFAVLGQYGKKYVESLGYQLQEPPIDVVRDFDREPVYIGETTHGATIELRMMK